MDIIENLKFGSDGLIPAIVQDTKGKVLMLGYMNMESFKKTIETGMVYFWSRSRKKLWKKGETSGHVQKIIEIRVDCDMDTLLFIVDQTRACCHEGYYSCFWRKLEENKWKITDKKIFNPERVYK
ncbi:MAG: phosphoribosyl-AMP cyclohydrolase [candidate division TA06 bacterium ADurb.Bin131]|jgi:phosphoribosyl-AMP cyclohydrolase|uniref:Phosphoribosyl-AMP cyclohydrolase n=1 Tax=candidate division TA06 bacterium ADurb.Bin131 TaxID=1852827 RepID=A0A1V6C4P3_UNCT6|nr:MAG: phosphoribosyl-AMP cyclohydrolase [candidate division TA06 bacterium ADurb.Bin131]HON04907.1 phosphoribosyl-AMP cyclohydrolase [bacterium]HQL65916.1 phosphoribosyl-AMP cyclohydrolase [bacterium]